jgi:hypothetical protein
MGRGGEADPQGIEPHRLGDVLERRLAEIADGEIEPGANLSICILGKADCAWLGDALEPCGDVDAVSHQIAVTLLDHVSEVNADAELYAALRRQAGIALQHRRLHLDGTAHGIDDTPELDKRAIARPLHDAPVMHRDGRIDQVAAERPEPRQGSVLVSPCEPAVSDHVRRQNCGKFSLLGHEHRTPEAKLARGQTREGVFSEECDTLPELAQCAVKGGSKITQNLALSCFHSASTGEQRRYVPRFRGRATYLICRNNLVAGVGFEPTTFRL